MVILIIVIGYAFEVVFGSKYQAVQQLEVFVASEIISFTCRLAMTMSKWNRWQTLMCFFSTVACSSGLTAVFSIMKHSTEMSFLSMFAVMMCKSSGAFFLYDKEFDVRVCLYSF
jgi:hypothetical protein